MNDKRYNHVTQRYIVRMKNMQKKTQPFKGLCLTRQVLLNRY